MNLQDKVVLITGARRVGSHLARLLADRGSHVALTDHTSRDVIEQTAAEVRTRGVQALAVAADLSDAHQAERAVDQVVNQLGRRDVLVNMASIYRPTPFAALSPGDFDGMIAANLAAPYHTSVASARRMLDRVPAPDGDRLVGKIITVGDCATDRPGTGYLPYLVAKGALTTMTLALAAELAPHVAVNLVQPAMIEPPPDHSPRQIADRVAASPLRRAGTPADLNNLILYLLEGTDFVTGACYRVDGGQTTIRPSYKS